MVILVLMIWWIVQPLPFTLPTDIHVVGSPVLRTDQPLVISRTACVNRVGNTVTRVMYWRREDGFEWPPQRETLTISNLGCGEFRGVYDIPDRLPPGNYTVKTDFIIYLNILRPATVIDGGTVEVQIVS